MKKILFLTLCMSVFSLGVAQQHHWTPVENFENTMDGIGVVIIDGVEQLRGDLELGIFCGDECRGSVFAEDEVEHWIYYFTMGGVANETFIFRLFDHALQQELDATCENEAVPFEANGFLGDWDAPYEIVFMNNTSSTITNTASGDWDDPATWGGTAPDPEANVQVNAGDVTIGDGGAVEVTVANLEIVTGATLTVEPGSTLIVTGDLTSADEEGLVIEDGAQVINGSADVKATFRKDITSYNAKDSDGWYTISSPVSEMAIAGSGFLTPNYDLYRYNETSIGAEWENYKDNTNTDFTSFENGRGYLYANSNTFSPTFTGTLNNADVSRHVTYTDRPDGLSGFNLIGNPFPHVVYKGAGGAIDDAMLASGYYTLTDEGAWHVHTYEDAIQPGQGILVKATATADLAIVKSTAVATAESNGAKSAIGRLGITVSGGGSEDRTYAYFGQGIGMEKMGNFSQQLPSLWIRDDGTDYAIAHVDNACESLDVCFRNRHNADYSLTIDTKDLDLGVLQLVDHATGVTVDLLQHPSYSFHAYGTEMDGRFRLVLKVATGVGEVTEAEPFAYVNNGNIVVNGEGTLQVIDPVGRIVMSVKTSDQAVSTSMLPSGVYILRLVSENKVRTQKIVIR